MWIWICFAGEQLTNHSKINMSRMWEQFHILTHRHTHRKSHKRKYKRLSLNLPVFLNLPRLSVLEVDALDLCNTTRDPWRLVCAALFGVCNVWFGWSLVRDSTWTALEESGECICVCESVSVYVSLWVYVCESLECICVCMWVSVCMWVYLCVCESLWVHLCVSLWVSVSLCMFEWLQIFYWDQIKSCLELVKFFQMSLLCTAM